MEYRRSENNFNGLWQLPLLPDYMKRWADITPSRDALVFVDTGERISYEEFDRRTDLYAMRLKKMGVSKGDIVAIQFLATPEFYQILYGCLKIGAILSPIDVKLQDHEVVRDLRKVENTVFFCLGKTPIRDFSVVAEKVKAECPFVKDIVQWTPNASADDLVEGAASFEELFGPEALAELENDTELKAQLVADYETINRDDGALIIFTTGTTGDPKPALMSHRNILTNNAIFSRGVGLWGSDYRYLNIMPTSHVAGTAQGPMTCWFCGGTMITMSIYHPVKSLEAVEEHRVTFFGGVPTQFRMIWALPNYKEFDLSSLRYSLYGGSAVDTTFLQEMAKMSPTFGTALGMTETAGYFTCTPKGISVEEMAGQVGQYYPELARVTIRKPMNADGSAGEVLPDGEAGEICVEGDVVFSGYYNNPEATAKCKTREGILYTGDMGKLQDKGTYRALVFTGRRKFVIKPKGYLVFPDEVIDFLSKHPKISQAHVVGVPHTIYVDGVFAFVQPVEDGAIAPEEVLEYCKGIASYKRPIHVAMWPAGEQFPLNRVNKVNSLVLIEKAKGIVEALREQGGWDAG